MTRLSDESESIRNRYSEKNAYETETHSDITHMEHTLQSHTEHPSPSTRENAIDIVNAGDPFLSCTADKLLSLILDDPADLVDDHL